MPPSQKIDEDGASSRPWILSAAYWNDVAKDVVKATCAAVVIYLSGVLGGVFKLHIQVLYILIVLFLSILLITFMTLYLRKRSGYLVIATVLVSGIGAGIVAAIASSAKWHTAGGWGVLIGIGFGLIMATAALVVELRWSKR